MYKKDRQKLVSVSSTDKMIVSSNKKGFVRRRHGGLVIVAVLWVVVVLMALIAVLGRKARLDMKVSFARVESSRCKWACRAGIEKAIGILNEDTRESDGLTDLWSDNDEDLNDIALEGCYFSVRVIDEASKLNINTATKEQLLWLPNMVEDIADAIIDWRDNDDMASGSGVEGGYYENLPLGIGFATALSGPSVSYCWLKALRKSFFMVRTPTSTASWTITRGIAAKVRRLMTVMTSWMKDGLNT